MARAQRSTTSLNDDWRFFMGESTWECSSGPATFGDFPLDLRGGQLQGLHPGSGGNAEECAASCGCTCQAWQWCNISNASLPCSSYAGSGCWIGNLQSLGPSNLVTQKAGWVGGGCLSPAVPPTQTTCPASPGFNASSWDVVTIPHDYLAGGTPAYSKDVLQQQHGYIPFSNAWYLHSFSAPESARRHRSYRVPRLLPLLPCLRQWRLRGRARVWLHFVLPMGCTTALSHCSTGL
jgi:hypothetical protein